MSSTREMILEDVENINNWNKAVEVPVLKRKRFLARKIHKLKKILKLSRKSFLKNTTTTTTTTMEEIQNGEHWQNVRNEQLERERKYAEMNDQQHRDFAECCGEQNVENENWDCCCCYMCCCAATRKTNCCYPSQSQQQSTAQSSPSANSNSICYVFMPGQAEPIAVKLRAARIPGGVMWISYRPDVDIYTARDTCSIMSSAAATAHAQIAQGQRPVLV